MAAPLDSRIADLAARQHGVVRVDQLRALGLGYGAVSARARVGRLHGVHHGVFAVGHPLLTQRARWMAAVLACGPGSLLSHRSAAALWGLRSEDRRFVDVTTVGRTGRRRPGISVHRPRSLPPAARAVVGGIPCTSVERTLLDLAEVVDRRQLERACNQAEVMRLLEADRLGSVLATRGRRAAAVLRDVLGDAARDDTVTRSELEERLLALCRGAELPQPRVNAWIAFADNEGVEVDFLWPDRRLIIETDGHAAHATRAAFESDRRRDQRLAAAGYRVVRFTWRQVTDDPHSVAATLTALLTR